MPKGVYKRQHKYKQYSVPIVQEIANKIETAKQQMDATLAENFFDATHEQKLQRTIKELESELLRVYRKLHCSVCDEY